MTQWQDLMMCQPCFKIYAAGHPRTNFGAVTAPFDLCVRLSTLVEHNPGLRFVSAAKALDMMNRNLVVQGLFLMHATTMIRTILLMTQASALDDVFKKK